jgi:hypothetical protein
MYFFALIKAFSPNVLDKLKSCRKYKGPTDPVAIEIGLNAFFSDDF